MDAHGPACARPGSFWRGARSSLKAVLLVAMAALLGGCAAQQLHQDGQALIEAGNYEQGLAKLEQAVKADSGDVSLRMSLYNNRERVVEQLLAGAEQARVAGDVRGAESYYRRAQLIAPRDFRIMDGLRLLEKRDVHAEVAKQAQAALMSGDLEQADGLAQKILSVDPKHAQALDVRAKVARTRARQTMIQPELKSRINRPVNLEFRDANIKMVFDALSRTSGINFMLDKEIKSDTKITIYVRNMAVEDAIDLALVQSQLRKKVLSENSVLIYPNTPQKLREYQDLVIRTFYLVNSDAKRAASALKDILKIKDMHVDDRLNMIFVRDTPDTIRLAEKMIRNQDMAEPEVILEMEVMEINRTRAIDLGVSWPDTFTWLVPDPSNITLDQLPFGQHRSRDRIGVNASMALKMKQDNSIANLLSNPRIRVKNRDKAKILVGDRVPIITATVTPGASNPVTTESISYLDVGLKLEAEPTVLLDDDVSIKVALEVSTLGERVETQSGSVAYRVGTRNVGTSLRLKDGETQVLMGLIRDEERNSASGVPGMVDLPVLGRLFSVPHDQKEKTEIVLSITPHIVRNVRRPEAHEMEFWSGTEASMQSSKPVLHTATASKVSLVQPVTEIPHLPVRDTGAAQATATYRNTQETRAAKKPAPSQPVQLSWSAPEGARVGEQFVVGIEADAPSPLMSAAMSLRFNPEVLEVVKVEQGELLQQAGAKTQFNHTLDPGRGRIALSLARPAPDGIQGKGRMFNLTFKALAVAAKTQVQVTSVSPVGPDDAPVAFGLSGPLSLSLKP